MNAPFCVVVTVREMVVVDVVLPLVPVIVAVYFETANIPGRL